MAESVCHGPVKCWAEFYYIVLVLRHEQTLFLPDMATDCGEGVAERRTLFVILGGRCGTTALSWFEAVCK